MRFADLQGLLELKKARKLSSFLRALQFIPACLGTHGFSLSYPIRLHSSGVFEQNGRGGNSGAFFMARTRSASLAVVCLFVGRRSLGQLCRRCWRDEAPYTLLLWDGLCCCTIKVFCVTLFPSHENKIKGSVYARGKNFISRFLAFHCVVLWLP